MEWKITHAFTRKSVFFCHPFHFFLFGFKKECNYKKNKFDPDSDPSVGSRSGAESELQHKNTPLATYCYLRNRITTGRNWNWNSLD